MTVSQETEKGQPLALGNLAGPTRTQGKEGWRGLPMGSVTQELSQAFLGFTSSLSHPRWTPNPTSSPPLPQRFHFISPSPRCLSPQAFVHHVVLFPVYTLVLVSLSHFFLSTPAAISKPFVFVLSSEKGCFEVAFLLSGSHVLSSIISTWPLSPHALSFHFISPLLCVCVHDYLCQKIKLIGPHLHSYLTAQWAFHVC